MSELENVRALIQRARSDAGAARELDELQCLMLAWLAERSWGGASPPAKPAMACLVRFDRHDALILDLLAKAAGVTAQTAAQRIVTQALFHPEVRAAVCRADFAVTGPELGLCP